MTEKIKFALISLPVNEYRFSITGLLIIATQIKKKMKDVEVRIIDNAFENINKELEKFNPDIIGLSTFTSYYQNTIDFAKKMKNKNPQIKIIVGGPHISTIPESFNPIFDYGVIGEGENTTLELLDAIMRNKDIRRVKGIIYFKNNKLIFNKRREFSKKLEWDINYSFMNKGYFEKRFMSGLYDFGVSLGIMTSLGCPFNCKFCSVKSCWDKIRFREVDNVVKEIKDLHDNFGVRHIDFYDDLFSVNKQRLRDFCTKLKEAGLLGRISFGCQVRTNCIDDEMCLLLKELNLKTVMFGFESGSDRVLQYIKSDLTLTVERHKKAVEICKKHGLKVYGSLILGIPGEKLEDMQKTIDFIEYGIKNNFDRLWTQVLVPLPGTEIWKIAEERGKIGKDFYSLDVNMHNKEKPLLLDPDVPYKDFLEKYNLAQKKCKTFFYKIMLKTFLKNPIIALYFTKDSVFYLKRAINLLQGAPIN